MFNLRMPNVTSPRKLTKIYQQSTVKLGYNELGYNEHSVITNKMFYLVGLGHFCDSFSWL